MVTLGLFSNNHPQEEFSQIWLKVREKIFNLIFNQTPLYTTTYALNMASFTFFFPPQNMVTLGHFYPKFSFVGLALPKICGENLSQKNIMLHTI
jgi:hypothetical protein